MLKINFHSLCFLALLFLDNPNVLCFSSLTPNDSSLPPTSSQQSLFPNISQQAGNNNSTAPLFSVTPQLYNCHFNISTNTFIPSFMLARWGNNMSTDTLNINYFSLPIIHNSEDFNNVSANTNNRVSSLIPNDSIPSNTTNTSAHIVAPRTKQGAHTNRNKDHALSEKHKKEKRTKTYKCPTCNKILASQGSLNYHIKTHDPNREKPYQCNLCYKSFFIKDALKKHIDRHNNEKPFKCDFCSKHFTTKYEKTMHHRTHTGEKPFKCNICKKRLSSKAALEGHLNNHRGKKPYSCDQCQKSFRQKGNLKEHLKLHKDEKPYKCTQCTKAYTSKGGLAYHIKTHNKPKAYTCPYCDAAFVYKSKYENHMRYEEERDEDRKCHRCKKMYAGKCSLREHNKRVHSGM